jgi:2-amino-4-hydroxy-6-hydroxymethyldihydropteridine diphosphokinase
MNGPLWRPAYIGVGSNLEDPVEQVCQGMALLGELPDTRLVLRSSLYRSAPMGPQNQPDFVNAVVAILTKIKPVELLRLTQELEKRQGRDCSAKRWGPRTLDLDLLAYSSVKMADRNLTLPHPGIAERNFVLLPWAEIAPHFCVPGLATVAQLAQSVAIKSPQITKIE